MPSLALSDTMTPQDATGIRWDVIVIGAGVAGAAAAIGMATQGRRTLILDKATFPRHKVCGGCLNAAALESLTQLGVPDLGVSLGAPITRRLQIYCGKRSPTIKLVPGRGISREALDTHLVNQACRCGADFLQQVTASVGTAEGGVRRLQIRSSQGAFDLEAGLVLVADGLNGRSLTQTNCAGVEVADRSYIGVSSILQSDQCQATAETIHMSVGRQGYFGIVQVEDRKWSMAAALNPMFVKASGGASDAIKVIAREAGFGEIGKIDAVSWRGTPQLSRRRPAIAAERMLVLGDAAGYVEPFTGEGMSWAFAAAQAVQDASRATGEQWDPCIESWWTKTYRRHIARRQRICRITRQVLRRPWLASALACAMTTMPRSSSYLIQRVGRPSDTNFQTRLKPWGAA